MASEIYTEACFTQADVKIIRQRTQYAGFFNIQSVQLQHKRFAGDYSQVLTREIVDRGDAVAILPYDPIRDTIVLIEQFRAGLVQLSKPTTQATGSTKVPSPWLLELPAGMISLGETKEAVAKRELYEETGLQAQQLEYALNYYSSPGGMTERIYLYLAHVDASQALPLAGRADENEDIRVVEIARKKVFELLSQGVINNAATVIGLQWFALKKQQD